MPGDAARLFEIVAAADERDLVGRHPASIEAARVWIEREMDAQDREGFSLWPAVEKEEGRTIGWCGLQRNEHGYVAMDCAFAPSARGRGYACEAALAVLQHARSVLGIEPVYVLVHPENAAGIALVHRVGLRFDQVLRAYRRDLLRYVSP